MTRQSLHKPAALASMAIHPPPLQGPQDANEEIFMGWTLVQWTPHFPSAPVYKTPSVVRWVPSVMWSRHYLPPLLPLPWVRPVPDMGRQPPLTAGTHWLCSSPARASTYLAFLPWGLGASLPRYQALVVPITYRVLGLPTSLRTINSAADH